MNSIDKTRQDKTRQDKTRQDNDADYKNYCQAIFMGSLLNHGPGFAGAIFSINGLSPTLTTMQGGGRMPHIVIRSK